MEGLGWWIYLCSVAGGILTVSLIFSIVFLAAFLITSVAYYNDECELRTAKKWRKYTGMRESDSTDVKYCRLIWIGQNDCDYESEKDYLVGTSPVGIQTNTNYQLENAGVGNFLTKLSYESRFFESKV